MSEILLDTGNFRLSTLEQFPLKQNFFEEIVM